MNQKIKAGSSSTPFLVTATENSTTRTEDAHPAPSPEAEAWREARQKYLGVEEEVPRIVAGARRELESWKAIGGKIVYGFRRDEFDVEMEKVAALVWLADELAKRPALTIALTSPLVATTTSSAK